MSDDPRLARLVSIDSYGHGSRFVVGVESGGRDAALNVATRDLASAATSYRRLAYEIRTAGNMLDSERGQRLKESAGPLLAALKAATKTYAQERDRINTLAATATRTKSYEAAPGHVLLIDLELCKQFRALPLVDQAIQKHNAANDPVHHLRMAEMLERLPAELTGVTPAERNAIRLGIVREFDAEGFAAIEAQQQQVTHAQRGLELALQVLSETSPMVIHELRQTAPDVLAIITPPPDDRPRDDVVFDHEGSET